MWVSTYNHMVRRSRERARPVSGDAWSGRKDATPHSARALPCRRCHRRPDPCEYTTVNLALGPRNERQPVQCP
jgi:hypothetical protein